MAGRYINDEVGIVSEKVAVTQLGIRLERLKKPTKILIELALFLTRFEPNAFRI
jgi:hypothetical protein